jgi:ketosteroid isomerase-like protein
MTTTATIPQDLDEALDRLAKALAAMGDGDPAPYAALWADSPDATLFGAWGPTEHGHAAVTTTFQWVAERFAEGSIVPTYDVVGVSGDLAYTVARKPAQCGSTGASPDP